MVSIELSDADVAFYRENGYILVPDVVSAEEIARLRAVTDELVEQSRQVRENGDVYDLEDSHAPDRPRVRRIKTPHKWRDVYASIVRHPNIITVLRRLIGPNIRFDTSKLNMKSEAGGAPVGWHQDWAFYPHTNDDLCATGLMLDDVGLDNGPMMVVPGSHLGPTYDHHVDGHFCGAINDPAADDIYAKAVPLTGTAGSLTVHHVRIVHGSAPNRSSRPRRFLLHQYRAADAWPLLGFPDIADYDDLMVAGETTIEPRLVPTPVRLPLPPAPHQGSIYENQRGLGDDIGIPDDEPMRAEAT